MKKSYFLILGILAGFVVGYCVSELLAELSLSQGG